ncbi:MAG: pyridoxal phosphate-dependent aminotransferase [Lachnospiraceae bacterium]
MGNKNEAFHGSDLEVISQKYRIAQDSILPYASNVNPLGMSPMTKEALIEYIDVVEDYPERNYARLRTAIGNYCDVNMEQIILGNGTSELIRNALITLKPDKTVILGPTYSEYKTAAELVGSEVEMYMLDQLNDFELYVQHFIDSLHEGIDMVIICNPNNPTGKAISKENMGLIVDACQRLNIFVMVDETYVEFVNNVSQISAVSLTQSYDNLLVLRSTSKFFCTPGLRLGYAITSNKEYLEAADDSKVPWNINSLASIASVMFSDEHYINLTSSLIQTERNLIYSALCSRKTIKVFKPDANFILIKLLKEDLTATEVFEYCLKKGFMIRDCTDYEGLGEKYVRFCFLKPEQNDRMVNTILEIV